MSQGSIEVWENVRATRWLANTLLKKNKQDLNFIDEALGKYQKRLPAIQKLWDQKILSIAEIKELVALSKDALRYYLPYYLSGIDDRTPKNILEKALQMRNIDDFFAKSDTVIRDSLISLYPEIKDYEVAIFEDELDALPALEVLKKRWISFFTVAGEGKFLMTLEEFGNAYPHFVFKTEKIKNSPHELRGEIAQKGYAKGRVKILRRRDQLGEVREGDIIVSPMTTTDFLPAMLRAAAIVTDEGGIACHAAITARELKKPCVTGTRIATQVLKDGDLVEVDADSGIIRILNN